MSVEDATAVVRSLYDAFNANDMDAVLAAFAPEFVLLDVPTGQTYRGPMGFMQWVRPFAVAAPDSRTEVTHIVAADDWVFTEHTGRRHAH